MVQLPTHTKKRLGGSKITWLQIVSHCPLRAAYRKLFSCCFFRLFLPAAKQSCCAAGLLPMRLLLACKLDMLILAMECSRATLLLLRLCALPGCLLASQCALSSTLRHCMWSLPLICCLHRHCHQTRTFALRQAHLHAQTDAVLGSSLISQH